MSLSALHLLLFVHSKWRGDSHYTHRGTLPSLYLRYLRKVKQALETPAAKISPARTRPRTLCLPTLRRALGMSDSGGERQAHRQSSIIHRSSPDLQRTLYPPAAHNDDLQLLFSRCNAGRELKLPPVPARLIVFFAMPNRPSAAINCLPLHQLADPATASSTMPDAHPTHRLHYLPHDLRPACPAVLRTARQTA